MTLTTGQRGGLIFALCGYILLSCGDAVIKSMAGEWPGPAIAATRFALGAIGLGALLLWRQGPSGFAVPRMGLQMARGFALASGSLCFFSALFIMPMAEAVAIQFAGPVVIAVLSWIFLREKVARATWGAMALATIGVVLVLRPNVALLGWGAALPVASMLLISVFMLLNRVSARDCSPLTAQFWVAAWATPVQCAAALAGQWSGVAALHIGTPDPSVLARCALVAVSASIAHTLLYLATTRASAAKIAPATYIQIVVALLVGYFAFHNQPDTMALAGIATIIAAGLWLWRSARAADPASEAEATTSATTIIR